MTPVCTSFRMRNFAMPVTKGCLPPFAPQYPHV